MNAAHVYTDGFGRILELTKEGAQILNVSPRGGQGRQLTHFITKDRQELVGKINVAARGHAVEVETVFRPKEKAPRPVVVHIARVENDSILELAWNFEEIR